MRYPPDHKPRTRRRIVKAAARRFRRQGYATTSIDRVMADGGLTVGGFYGHFRSKEELLASVLDVALEQTRKQLLSGLEELSEEERVQEVVRRYLSRQHRDQASDGCALPALASELSRQGARARRVLGDYVASLVAELERSMPGADELSPRDRVLGTLSLCVGALTLARAVGDRELSDDILMAGRRYSAALTTEDEP